MVSYCYLSTVETHVRFKFQFPGVEKQTQTLSLALAACAAFFHTHTHTPDRKINSTSNPCQITDFRSDLSTGVFASDACDGTRSRNIDVIKFSIFISRQSSNLRVFLFAVLFSCGTTPRYQAHRVYSYDPARCVVFVPAKLGAFSHPVGLARNRRLQGVYLSAYLFCGFFLRPLTRVPFVRKTNEISIQSFHCSAASQYRKPSIALDAGSAGIRGVAQCKR